MPEKYDYHPDLDLNTVGTGCATGCGAGCIQYLLLWAVIILSGVDWMQLTPTNIPLHVRLFGLFSSALVNFIIGYVVAIKAPYEKMRHAIVVPAIFMLVSLIGLFQPATNAAMRTPWYLISFLLTIPMSLWGASYGIAIKKAR